MAVFENEAYETSDNDNDYFNKLSMMTPIKDNIEDRIKSASKSNLLKSKTKSQRPKW